MNKLYVVGIGPGAYEKMTIEAANALKNSDVIIGYTVYVDLVKEHEGQDRIHDLQRRCRCLRNVRADV